MLGDSQTKPMEILLVEDGLTDARVTIFAVRRSQVYHRLTLVRTVNEAIQFLNRVGIFARAPSMSSCPYCGKTSHCHLLYMHGSQAVPKMMTALSELQYCALELIYDVFLYQMMPIAR